MKLTNQFEVPLDAQSTWKTLMDIEHVASCVPGARLTEVSEDGAYKGEIAVRLGPVALSFKGTARFLEQDDTAMTALVKAQGADVKGRGGASANIRMWLDGGSDGATRANLETDVNLSGSIAQYGRASGMIEGLATEITNQFAANLRNSLDHQQSVSAQQALGSEAGSASAGKSTAEQQGHTQSKAIGGFSLFFKVMFQKLSGLLFSSR